MRAFRNRIRNNKIIFDKDDLSWLKLNIKEYLTIIFSINSINETNMGAWEIV